MYSLCLLAVAIMQTCVSGAEPAAASPLVLAENGAARAFILAPASPSIVEKYAAEQMATALGRMSGGTFRIVNETASPPQSYSQPVISIGRTALAKDLPMQGPEWKRVNPEAFRILRRGNALIICGNQIKDIPDTGTIWGVYTFLEMQGVGSYMGDEDLGKVFPDKPAIAVDAVDVTDAPWFEMRSGCDTVSKYLIGAGEKPGDLFGFGRNAASMGNEFNHSFQYIATAQVRKDHPEWFAGTHNSTYGTPPGENPPIGYGLPDNGICLSRPEIRNLFIEYFRKRFHENPDLKMATICPDDYTLGYRCECAECKRLMNLGRPLTSDTYSIATSGTQQRSSSDLNIDFANAVANGLEKDFPDRKLITYAYNDYIDPPTTIRVHPNVIIMLVGYWNNSTPTMDKVARGWQAMGAQKLYWYGWLLTRPPVPHLMGEWYRNFKRSGIEGVYMEFAAVPTSNMINQWLMCKLSWNPDADVGQLLDAYFFGLFGPEVGLQMRRFFLAAWEVNPPVNDAIPGLLAAAEKMAGDPGLPVGKRVRFFKLGWELYHSAFDLDDALKAADIPRAHQVVKSGIATAEALARDYPWAIRSDVWLHNTAHMEYSVTVLPALETLLNTKVVKPAPEAPAPGPLLCLTGNADVPTSERIDSGVTVAFDLPATGGPDGRKLFDGQTAGSEHSLSHGGAFPVWTITLDLKKSYQVDRVEICTGLTSGRWDVVPIYIEVQVSADGKDFRPVERILPRTLKGFAQSGDLFVTARHVRFRLASLNMWHAVSEVRVWGRPAPAEAADAPPPRGTTEEKPLPGAGGA